MMIILYCLYGRNVGWRISGRITALFFNKMTEWQMAGSDCASAKNQFGGMSHRSLQLHLFLQTCASFRFRTGFASMNLCDF